MPSPTASRPHTLAELRSAVAAGTVRRRPVKDEIRENLICRLRAKETLFPGIIGYDETVVPQIVNAVLSRHNFILLGLRGQAKSRILRALSDLLEGGGTVLARTVEALDRVNKILSDKNIATFIEKQKIREVVSCPSTKVPSLHSMPTIFKSTVVDFMALQKPVTKKTPKQSSAI